MTNFELLARSENLGKITRDFKSALDVFDDKAINEVRNIRQATNANGLAGDTAEDIRREIEKNLREMEKQVELLKNLSDRLEGKAVQYDKLVAVLRSAGNQ